MKKILLSFLVFAIAIATTLAQNTVILKSGQSLSDNAAQLNTIFKTASILEDITNIKNYVLDENPETKQQYLSAEGTDKNQNRVVFRAAVTTTPTEAGLSIDFGTTLRAESCVGVNCSSCRFAKTGGCECERKGDRNGTAYCNHNISKP